VAGLVVGAAGWRLVMGRGRSTKTEGPAVPTEPEPAAASAPPVSSEPEAEEAAEAQAEAPAEVSAEAPAEVPASAVDDVVAELERRVKGRRTDGEADRTTGGRRERIE